ncbi:5-oxoprolinase subunit PxpB [Ureibacillus sp. Re31]|uniref:5-oxoprolinase subunit PxpB n=1 Tax=Ureibacillus galli TaxID=2762222 RepID=A0ABR8XB02_9BACL|nr:5-oxoprolinase subunit PxpB [Ureibacillus galli]MBD8026383.1 5-oxoprolinase subunit PxpB [Ureibacillus galli]
MIPKMIIQDRKVCSFLFGQEINGETFQIVRAFDQFIIERYKRIVIESVPSYHMVTVFFNKSIVHTKVLQEIMEAWSTYSLHLQLKESRKITIPVCYETPFSLDLERVATENHLSVEKVVKMHCESLYTVFLIGFLPGFPYLGGLREEIYCPRLDVPRRLVEKGSVGIGGKQTGIYPIDSPGGWNIIGKTPIPLFDLNRSRPFLLQAGDQLSFKRITMEQFQEIEYQLKEDSNAVIESLLGS